MVPEDLKFSKTHEWARVEGDTVTVGITEFAVNQLGDVVFLELPAPGDSVSKGGSFGVIESVKAAVDLESPATGEVAQANESLSEKLDSLGDDPYGESWMIKVTASDSSELDSMLSAAVYAAYIEGPECQH